MLSEILSSPDETTKIRGITLLISTLTTEPLSILQSFDSYYEVLTNISNLSLEHVSHLIYTAIKENINNIEEPNISLILKYFVHFLDSPTAVFRSYITENSSKPSELAVRASEFLFTGKPYDYCYLDRLRVLVATHNSKFLITEPDKKKLVAEQFADNTEVIHYLTLCLDSKDIKIKEYAADVLVEALKINSEITRQLYPKLPSFVIYENYTHSIKLRNLHEILAKLFKEEDSLQKNNETLNKMLAVKAMHSSFSLIDGSAASKIMRKTKRVPCHNGTSSSILRKAELVIEPKPKRITSSSTIEMIGPINGYLEKLGGKFGQWQTRHFTYYPQSRTLVWRIKPEDPKIKGLMMFESTITIERPGLEKGKQHVLVMRPRTGKSYKLAFPDKEMLQKWFDIITESLKLK